MNRELVERNSRMIMEQFTRVNERMKCVMVMGFCNGLMVQSIVGDGRRIKRMVLGIFIILMGIFIQGILLIIKRMGMGRLNILMERSIKGIGGMICRMEWGRKRGGMGVCM